MLNRTELLKFILSKKALLLLILPVALLIIFLAFILLPPTPYNIPFSINYKFDISPELQVDLENLRCIYSNESLTATINQPSNNTAFLATNSINFIGSYSYKCRTGNVIKEQWFLDGSDTQFAEGSNAYLSDLKAGYHTIKYVINAGKISTTQSIQISVNNPEIPNNAPIVSIRSPIESQIYSNLVYEMLNQTYKIYADVLFSGSATDPEDGNLSDNSLTWFYQLQGGPRIQSASVGNSFTERLYANDCNNARYAIYSITLVANDSKGKTSEKSVQIQLDNANLCS